MWNGRKVAGDPNGVAARMHSRRLTGATDVVSVLVREGLRTTLIVAVPDADALRDVSGAAVVALKTRTSPPADAVEQSLAALARLRVRAGRSRAVVHLHATHSVAVSVLADIDPENVLPPITAYYVMRVGTLPLIPNFAPGDQALVEAVRLRASKHAALLLANHGPVLAGTSLPAAVDAIEELEETARLYLLLAGRKLRCLDAQQVAALQAGYPIL